MTITTQKHLTNNTMTKTKESVASFLIHSINEDMFQLSKSEAEWKKIFKKAKEMEQTNYIESLIDRNYNATKERGQITSDTTFSDFKLKIHEELKELSNSYYENVNFDPKELADIILVCFSMAKHFNIDIMQVLSDKVAYNEKRED